MQLTRAADYGVRVMIDLANVPPGTRSSLGQLAESAEVSPAFLSKVLQRLVRAGLVASRRGKRGGFELVDVARGASLIDILAALDGVPQLNSCLLDGGCHRSPFCAAHAVWVEAQEQMRRSLAAATLDSLARQTRDQRAAFLRPTAPPTPMPLQ
jgi:Rrf2 family protein